MMKKKKNLMKIIYNTLFLDYNYKKCFVDSLNRFDEENFVLRIADNKTTFFFVVYNEK